MPSESLLGSGPGLLLAQTPAQPSVQRASSAGTVAVLDTARTPAMASVAGPRPRMRCPPIRFRRPGPGGPAPSGVQSPGSSSRIRCPAVWCPPVRCPALWCPPPSVRTRPSGPPSGGGGWGSADAARQPAPRERAQVPVGCRVVERLGSTASRPGRERRRRGHAWSAGRSVADPGRVGCERRPGLTLASPGRPGQPADRRRRRRRCGHGRRPQPRLPHRRQAAVLGMGGRPRCVVVVAPAARVDGPGGADGLAGGDGRAAPARPRLAASVPGLLPTAL